MLARRPHLLEADSLSQRFRHPAPGSSRPVRFGCDHSWLSADPGFVPQHCWRRASPRPPPPSLLPGIRAVSNALSLIHSLILGPFVPPPAGGLQRLPLSCITRTFSTSSRPITYRDGCIDTTQDFTSAFL